MPARRPASSRSALRSCYRSLPPPPSGVFSLCLGGGGGGCGSWPTSRLISCRRPRAPAGRPDEKRALRASHALYGCCCCCTLLGLGTPTPIILVTQPLPQRTNNVFFQSGLPGCQMPTSTIDSLSIHVR